MEKTMRLIHEQTIKRASKTNQEGELEMMKEWTTEAREVIDLFRSKYGTLTDSMNEAVGKMLAEGDGDSLMLYSHHLLKQWEYIMEAFKTRPTMMIKDGLELDDVLTMKVKS